MIFHKIKKFRRERSDIDMEEILDIHSQAALGTVLNSVEHGNQQFYSFSQESDVICVFVVAFDHKTGNEVEWIIPEDFVCDGLEFKSLPSGAHTVEKDFVYFTYDNLFGLSCYRRQLCDLAAERGSRIKSVGILTTKYHSLHLHASFLDVQVQKQLTSTTYNELEEFYTQMKGCLGSDFSLHDSWIPTTASGMQDASFPRCVHEFLDIFGDHVMVLWKLVILKTRLFLSMVPPVTQSCHFVYYLAVMSLNDVIAEKITKPLFYTSLTDIERLQVETTYIACATDKIFETKDNIFDVFIDGHKLTSKRKHLDSLLKPNHADRRKLAILKLILSQSSNDKDGFLKFFKAMNNSLFETLFAVSTSDSVITAETMLKMSLDPVADQNFLLQVIETYGFDINPTVGDSCCLVR